MAAKGGNIFGRLVSGLRKVGGYIFKGLNGLFHHHKNVAISCAVEVFKKYDSNLTIGQLFKFKEYFKAQPHHALLGYPFRNKAAHT